MKIGQKRRGESDGTQDRRNRKVSLKVYRNIQRRRKSERLRDGIRDPIPPSHRMAPLLLKTLIFNLSLPILRDKGCVNTVLYSDTIKIKVFNTSQPHTSDSPNHTLVTVSPNHTQVTVSPNHTLVTVPATH